MKSNETSPFQLGDKAYREENYTEAAKYFLQIAEKENAEVLFKLGEMYYEGKGVEKNISKAFEYYEKSIEKKYYFAKKKIKELSKNGEQKAKEIVDKYSLQENSNTVTSSNNSIKNVSRATIITNTKNTNQKTDQLFDSINKKLKDADNLYKKGKNKEAIKLFKDAREEAILSDNSNIIDTITQIITDTDIILEDDSKNNNTEKYEWTPEAKQALKYIQDGEPIVFLTGGAGTGKSTFIKQLKEQLQKNIVILAPTGIAAINAGGQTIHSFFKFSTDVFEDDEITVKNKNPVLDYTDLIIIDEISMVSAWMLDHIDYALRLWSNDNRAFGGKQMLLMGDCFQLPPIKDDDKETENYYKRWDNTFFFAAHVLERSDVNMKAVQLKKIFRQKNNLLFSQTLNRIRKCELGYIDDIIFLNNNCLIENRIGTENVPEECLYITSTNADAEKFNSLKLYNLQKVGKDTRFYRGEVNGSFNFKNFLTPKTLELCVGSRIMVTKNIRSLNLVNGDRGHITGLGNNFVKVYIDRTKKEYFLSKETWQSIRYKWDEKTKTIQQIPEGTFKQIPLKLGWAVTIHKSQGLTLENVAIKANDAWEDGQIYVALSRAKSWDGILLREKLPIASVKADEYILKKYETLFPDSDESVPFDASKYKNITFDNSRFTINKTKELRTVLIGNQTLELYPKGTQTIQDHVIYILRTLLNENLIPGKEMNKLLTDKDYCYNTFGICYKCKHNIDKFTLLRKLSEGACDGYGYRRYWATKTTMYYKYLICSQWHSDCIAKFARWLIALSKGEIQ